VFPDAFFLHHYRDPLATISSMLDGLAGSNRGSHRKRRSSGRYG
jgi:hypothetical protein